MRALTAHDLKAMLADAHELALIDLREELIFSERHLLWARSVPLSRLELRMARLVPRKTTRTVLVDDADGLAERAAKVLQHAGYPNLHILDSGNLAWEAAGPGVVVEVRFAATRSGALIEVADTGPGPPAEIAGKLFELRSDPSPLDLQVPALFHTGTNGLGAGTPGGMGIKLDYTRPIYLDSLAADFPGLTIIGAHPSWP